MPPSSLIVDCGFFGTGIELLKSGRGVLIIFFAANAEELIFRFETLAYFVADLITEVELKY